MPLAYVFPRLESRLRSTGATALGLCRSVRPLPALLALAACAVPTTFPGADDPIDPPEASAAGPLSGKVTGPEGSVADATVTTVPGGVQTTTDAVGNFAIPRLTPGAYQVVVTAPGLATATSDAVAVGPGLEGIANVTLIAAIPVDGLVHVRVSGPDGVPWAGAEVTVYGVDGPVAGATDAEGALTIAGLGGTTVDVGVDEPTGRLWSRSVADLAVPTLGAADIAVTLAGRPKNGTMYAGSTICAMCHAAVASEHTTTAHARAMSAVTGVPAGGFDLGKSIDLGDAVATLTRVGGAPVVRLEASDGEVDVWPVAGFIGGAERGAVPWAERGGLAFALPLAWVPPEPDHETWAPGGWVAGPTAAFFTTDGHFAYADAPDSAASAESACFGCHNTGYTLAADGAGGVTMRAATQPTGRWDETGVGCEACHGPGIDHTSGAIAQKTLSITNPNDLDAADANDVCGQCHAAVRGDEGTPYPWDATHGLFRPGERLSDVADSAFVGWASGAAAIPGAAADELARSGHATGAWSARCNDCHAPHGSSLRADLRLEHRDNALCVTCHKPYSFGGSDAAVTTHTGHVYAPASLTESARCTGCHMPGTAARLSYNPKTAAGDLASHRFAAIAPADSIAAFDAAGVDALAPGAFVANACQACHAWNDDLFSEGFPGPAGDMTRRATHAELQEAFEEKFP